MATLSRMQAGAGNASAGSMFAFAQPHTLRGQIAATNALLAASLGRAAPVAGTVGRRSSVSAFLIVRFLNQAAAAVCDLRQASVQDISDQLDRHARAGCYAASLRYLEAAGHDAIAAEFKHVFARLTGRNLLNAQRDRQARIAALQGRILTDVADGHGSDALRADCMPKAPAKAPAKTAATAAAKRSRRKP